MRSGRASLVVLSGPRRTSVQAELALVTLVDALRGRRAAAPGRVVGWWPDSGHLVRVEPEPALLTLGARAVAAVLADAPPVGRTAPARPGGTDRAGQIRARHGPKGRIGAFGVGASTPERSAALRRPGGASRPLRPEGAPESSIVGTPMGTRQDIRNVAIVAHVDHGKTTLVHALLRQTGAFGAHQELTDRVMDSGTSTREGITILAKHTAVRWGGIKINIVDTPGTPTSAVRWNGVCHGRRRPLLVDASEGPLPQTRFVLRKTLEARLPVILVVNKVDRADARIDEVVHQVEDLFLDLDADEHQIGFPILYANARAGWASTEPGSRGTDRAAVPRPSSATSPLRPYDTMLRLQALVCNLVASPYIGRLADLPRCPRHPAAGGDAVAWCRLDGTVERAKITELYVTDALDRVRPMTPARARSPSVAGLAEVTIGETLADPERPVALPAITVDEPSLTMTIGINTSPLSPAQTAPSSPPAS